MAVTTRNSTLTTKWKLSLCELCEDAVEIREVVLGSARERECFKEWLSLIVTTMGCA